MTEPRAVYTVPGKPEPKEWKCECGFPFGIIEDGHLSLEIANGAFASVEGYAKIKCPDCKSTKVWCRKEVTKRGVPIKI
jgi:hypothetical protein